MNEFLQEVMDLARDQLEAAKEQKQAIKQQFEEAARVEKTWEDLLLFASRDWYMHILDLLKKQPSIFDKMCAENHNVASMFEKMLHLATTEADIIIRRYPTYFEESCRKANLPLDSDSRHPRYNLNDGFFRLEIDEKKRIARLSNNEGRLAELPADVSAVAGTIQREYKRIFERPFDGKKFLKRLRKEYIAILKKEKQEDGVSIPIRHITRRLGKNVKGFRTDEFLVDLSRLVGGGPFEIDGRRLDLQQTKDTNQGMLLHGAAGRGYIGFIIFKEAQA